MRRERIHLTLFHLVEKSLVQSGRLGRHAHIVFGQRCQFPNLDFLALLSLVECPSQIVFDFLPPLRRPAAKTEIKRRERLL